MARPALILPNETIADLYNSGLSIKQVAKKIGVSEKAISTRLKKMGITRTLSEAMLLKKERGELKVSRYWAGKKVPKEIVEKRASKTRGENHYLWKGGKEKRDYREVITKEKCAKCGTKEKLGIHHKDLDHYNNKLENLEVLCVSCHSSIHKKMYWDAIRAGKEPLKTNAPIRWKK